MPRYLYCCPICGHCSAAQYNMIFCDKCNTPCDNPIISKYPLEYYQKEAERRFPKSEDGLIHGTKGLRRFHEILLEEISQNPQFDKEKCIKWIEKENAEYDMWKSDRDKGIQPTPIVTHTPQLINTPKCPMCNSPHIKRISTLNRMISITTFGLASSKIGKQYECKSCKHKW